MLQNAYFLAKFGFGTAENEPAKHLQTLGNFANQFRPLQARDPAADRPAGDALRPAGPGRGPRGLPRLVRAPRSLKLFRGSSLVLVRSRFLSQSNTSPSPHFPALSHYFLTDDAFVLENAFNSNLFSSADNERKKKI